MCPLSLAGVECANDDFSFMSMDQSSRYFTLSLHSLRTIGSWAADCAESALPIFEAHAGHDSRPRAAIAGIRAFAGGGKRTTELRLLATAANAAAREVSDVAAAAAARAAAYAAASAYTHPLIDVRQTKHIVGPAAYAILALELSHADGLHHGEAALLSAIERAPMEVSNVLRHMPARQPGRGRLETLLYAFDSRLRARLPQEMVP